jgi:hypothetical protein
LGEVIIMMRYKLLSYIFQHFDSCNNVGCNKHNARKFGNTLLKFCWK